MLEMAGAFAALIIGIGAIGGLFDFAMSDGDSHEDADDTENHDDDYAETEASETANGILPNDPDDSGVQLANVDNTGMSGDDLDLSDIDSFDDPADETSGESSDTIVGTADRENLYGNENDNLIEGGDGTDTVYAGAGDDTVLGEAGNDVLLGQDGDDTLIGGDGGDTLSGQNGNDTLLGGAGQDRLTGSQGDDFADGGDDDDYLEGNDGNDHLIGGLGTDIAAGGFGNDILDGRVLDENGLDQDGQDFLNGGYGNDFILAGTADYVTTGDGDDTVVLGEWSDATPEILITVTDFAPEHDSIVITYEGTADAPPELGIETDADDSNLQYVLVDGNRVAIIKSDVALDLGSFELVPVTELAQLSA